MELPYAVTRIPPNRPISIEMDEARRGDSVIPIDSETSRDMTGAAMTVTEACMYMPISHSMFLCSQIHWA